MNNKIMTLEEIGERRKEIETELNYLKDLEYSLLCEKAGIKPGDKVRHTKDGYDGMYEVTEVSQFHFPKPFVKGNLIENGTISYRSKDLYGNWEKITP